MDFSLFHFAQGFWLCGLLAIPPVIAVGWLIKHGAESSARRLEKFADRHLLPHLLGQKQESMGRIWRPLALWSFIWALGVIALAGPQWRYTDTDIYQPENDLVILLDLSSTMNATDIKPSRLDRAREKIADILALKRGLTIGLIAYAEVPHMVVPLTDDTNMIMHLLPSLDTSLITIDGDRLQPAIRMASGMLKAEPGQNKSILIISDGDFKDSDIDALVRAADGARIFTMGVGTQEGAPASDNSGNLIKDASGQVVIERLEANKLAALAAASHGAYVEAGYGRAAAQSILDQIGRGQDSRKLAGKTIRTWDEGFYIPLLAAAVLLLPCFRKGRGFLLALFFLGALLPASQAHAAGIADWFRNPDQQGAAAYQAGHYDEALAKFRDPYRQGVAAYKAGQYARAAGLFQKAAANDPGTAATYNLGNAQLMQMQPEAAIKSYEAVLKRNPDDAAARHNLEIAKKLLQQQSQDKQETSNQNNQSDESKTPQNGSNGANKQASQSGQQNAGKKGASGQGAPDKNQPNPQQARTASQQGKSGDDQNRPEQKSPEQQAENKNSAQQNAPQKTSSEASAQGKQENNQLQSGLQGQQAQQPSGERGPEKSPGQREGQTQSQAQQNPEQADNSTASGNKEDAQPPGALAADSRPRTQRDIDADQWLNHIQSDPGSFLKNQFMIEEKQSAEGGGQSND